jgi:hypothetical protein
MGACARLNEVYRPAAISVAIQPFGASMPVRSEESHTGSWIMNHRTKGLRAFVLAVVTAIAVSFTSGAFAHGHFAIGISVPGVTVGYWGGHHGYGYVGFGGYYAPYYYVPPPVYYAPAPVVIYERPAYYYHRCYARPYYDRYGDYHPGYYYSC